MVAARSGSAGGCGIGRGQQERGRREDAEEESVVGSESVVGGRMQNRSWAARTGSAGGCGSCCFFRRQDGKFYPVISFF